MVVGTLENFHQNLQDSYLNSAHRKHFEMYEFSPKSDDVYECKNIQVLENSGNTGKWIDILWSLVKQVDPETEP